MSQAPDEAGIGSFLPLNLIEFCAVRREGNPFCTLRTNVRSVKCVIAGRQSVAL